jgi:uncharacterized membrane protein YfcA
MSVEQVLVIAAAFIIAGIAKGAIGMGLPPIALGLLSFALPMQDALPIMVVPSMATNIWQAIYGRGFWKLLFRFRAMAVSSAAALIFVAVVFGQLGSQRAAAWVGIILVLYAALAFTRWRPSVSRLTERWANPLVGAASGAVAGITGVAAVPFLPYMQSLDIDRHDLVQALGIMFVFIIGTLTAALVIQGSFTATNLLGGIGAILPTFLGVWLGQKARHAVSAETFRRIFLIGMFVVGLQMATSLL